eukprot:203142-Pleurochrysis_carterae.AAC.1
MLRSPPMRTAGLFACTPLTQKPAQRATTAKSLQKIHRLRASPLIQWTAMRRAWAHHLRAASENRRILITPSTHAMTLTRTTPQSKLYSTPRR